VKKLLFILLFVLNSTVYSQTQLVELKRDTTTITPKEFDKNALENYKSDTDFNYEEASSEPNLFQKIFMWLSNQFMRVLQWLFGVEKATGIFQFLMKTLPYIVLLVLLFLIIKMFIKFKTNYLGVSIEKKAVVDFINEEELIKNEDLDSLIQKAITNQNYTLAVRYLYIKTLKVLDKKGVISWEQQKTNEDYIAEISSTNLKHKFTELTYLYDFVWYGNFAINAQKFQQINTSFTQLNQQISSKNA